MDEIWKTYFKGVTALGTVRIGRAARHLPFIGEIVSGIVENLGWSMAYSCLLEKARENPDFRKLEKQAREILETDNTHRAEKGGADES